MSAANRNVNALLKDVFLAKHADAAVRHFQDSVEDFELNKWDDASAKGGKFIEAVVKALWVYAKETVPPGKQFSVGKILPQLENRTTVPDTIRLTIPRSCRFAYEIASNRGARHDPDEIEANEMDARTVLANCAWILSERVRFSQKGNDLDLAKSGAYHRHIQIGLIAQGLLQYLSASHAPIVWSSFGSWLRTIRPGVGPSELVTAIALRNTLPDFLLNSSAASIFTKFLRTNIDPDHARPLRLSG